MDPVVSVALLSLLFVGSHVGLATGRLRGELVGRLGASGFTLVYFVVAASSFSWLAHTYALHRFEGPPGLDLGALPVFRWVAIAAIGASLMLVGASLSNYPRSPMALFSTSVGPPRGIERVTRHSMFVGVALLGAAHALLATRLIGAVFWAGFAVLGLIGARHQDAKLLTLRGSAYSDYLAQTSSVPFAAILAGRQRLVLRELPLVAISLGLACTFWLRSVHDAIFDAGGAWVIGAMIGGALVATLQSWLRSRRLAPPAFPGADASRSTGVDASTEPKPEPQVRESREAPWTP